MVQIDTQVFIKHLMNRMVSQSLYIEHPRILFGGTRLALIHPPLILVLNTCRGHVKRITLLKRDKFTWCWISLAERPLKIAFKSHRASARFVITNTYRMSK